MCLIGKTGLRIKKQLLPLLKIIPVLVLVFTVFNCAGRAVSPGPGTSDKIADLDQEVKNLETIQAEETARLGNRLKIVEDRTIFSDSISFEMQNEIENLMTRIELLEKNTAKVLSGNQQGNSPDLTVLTDEEYRAKYISALASYQNGDYSAAEKAFRELLQINPLHDLADNSQYWIGEIYYARKNYRQALEEFQKVMDFKDTNKADHALFKIGLCYLNLGDTQQARATFLTHVTKYPNSELYSRSKSYLDQN